MDIDLFKGQNITFSGKSFYGVKPSLISVNDQF